MTHFRPFWRKQTLQALYLRCNQKYEKQFGKQHGQYLSLNIGITVQTRNEKCSCLPYTKIMGLCKMADYISLQPHQTKGVQKERWGFLFSPIMHELSVATCFQH